MSVLIISTLNTKGEETKYLKEKIESFGVSTIVMDLSMKEGSPWKAEIPPEKVAEAGGSKWEDILSSADRAKNTEIMINGAIKTAKDLLKENKFSGVVGIGGSTGSLMATEVMRALPFGVPKLMISSTAALPGLSTRYIGTGDIMLFHSVIEISGINDLLKNVIDRAAASISCMVSKEITPISIEKGRAKRIAITMLGPCENCASKVRKALEEMGMQVIGFSASGICDRAMEDMILQGVFDGVVDLAPGGVGEHIFKGTRDAGPNRLESAGKVGIPQVVAPCSVNHLTLKKSQYTEFDHQRPKYHLDRYRTWLRATKEELKTIAEEFARKLNQAKGPVIFVYPKKGWSSVDKEGNPTYNPQEDLVFLETFKKLSKPHIKIIEVDANLEDEVFADEVIKACKELFI